MSSLRAYAVVLLACPLCAAATIVVDRFGTGDYTAIQPAVDAANDGDTVLVGLGAYLISAPIRFHGKSIRVQSERGSEKPDT